MFGYVVANKPEMKMREFARYRGFYCGLCHSLKGNYGRAGQFTLTYDMVFLIILLSSLYEPATEEMKKRCLIHPGKKQYMLTNEISDYAAGMNLLLAHGHLEDDWRDDRRAAGFVGMKLLSGKKRKIERRYPRQAKAVRASLIKLSELEKNGCRDIDEVSRPFGEMMAELFVWKEDAFQKILRSFGFYLGKFVYILDAGMDLEEDAKKGRFNPFLEELGKDGFQERLKGMLDGTIRMAAAEFEKLPCEQDIGILRNILYEGVFVKSERKFNHDE